MNNPVCSHTHTHITHTPHKPHIATHVLCCVVVCGLSTQHTMPITDARPIFFAGFHPFETAAFLGANTLHMIVNHGKGRDK